jgi:acetylglutamate kinase
MHLDYGPEASDMSNQTVVIKVGGDVLLDDAELVGLCANVKELGEDGWRVVVLHGGGPQVDRLQKLHGLVPNKVGGRRITSLEDLRVVKQAICGEANVDLVSALLAVGVEAFGCTGASGRLIQAHKRPPRVVSGAGDDPVDFGEVGDVETINAPLLNGLLDLGVVPVIATLGVATSGRVFNINGDTTVVQIARTLEADFLLLTTRVGAIFVDLDDPSSRVKVVSAGEARAMIGDGVIVGGMIPKVEEALSVLGSDGVKNIAVVSGREPGAFLAVARGSGEHGTRITL